MILNATNQDICCGEEEDNQADFNRYNQIHIQDVEQIGKEEEGQFPYTEIKGLEDIRR